MYVSCSLSSEFELLLLELLELLEVMELVCGIERFVAVGYDGKFARSELHGCISRLSRWLWF